MIGRRNCFPPARRETYRMPSSSIWSPRRPVSQTRLWLVCSLPQTPTQPSAFTLIGGWLVGYWKSGVSSGWVAYLRSSGSPRR